MIKWGKVPRVHFGILQKLLVSKNVIFCHLLHGGSGGIMPCLKIVKENNLFLCIFKARTKELMFSKQEIALSKDDSTV